MKNTKHIEKIKDINTTAKIIKPKISKVKRRRVMGIIKNEVQQNRSSLALTNLWRYFNKTENKQEIRIQKEIRPIVKHMETQVKNGLEIRVLKMQDMNVESENIKRFQLGESNNGLSNGRLILVGETGSGKTTLVHSIVNYLLGVKFSDNFRYSLFDLDSNTRSESESQTDFVTEYRFNYIDGMNKKCNFVFVDTPGLEDTRGVEVQKENLKQILKYIRKHQSNVGLVIQSSTCRLTTEQTSILLDMKTLIEAGNISSLTVLSTFADSDSPSVIDVLEGFEIPYTHLFLFNNNALYSRNQGISPNDLLSFEMNWDASNSSIDTLLDVLKNDAKAEVEENTNKTKMCPINSLEESSNYNTPQIQAR